MRGAQQRSKGRRRSVSEKLSKAPSETKAMLKEKLYEQKEDLNHVRSARPCVCARLRARAHARARALPLPLPLLYS